ncbi:MgtC/SapB family protein [Aeromonas caviae]|uniref:MgtC/SapB family protein n=1 Tax=Aeromonas caviae TaxID=648 RepID=UPI002B492199|nr:MgtC/SapB family protein [Aeromonas caviae]
MRMWQQLDFLALLDTLSSLLLAFVLGSLVGLERQYRQRTAGLRTNVLVAVGAALFVNLAQRIYDLHGGSYGVVHVVAYIVSGIGFLGAGVIMRESGNIRGINTAATLWGVAAVGAACGAGFALEAILGALFVLAANTLLRPLVNQINRDPVDNMDTEVTYHVTALIGRAHQKEVLPWLEQMLEQAHYPLSELDITPFGDQDLEISAALLATAIDGTKLDVLMNTLGEHPHIKQIFWRASITD